MERAELKTWVLDTGVARVEGEFVFLCDPQWGAAEKSAVGERTRIAPRVDARSGWLCIPTGGTSGEIRFARHDETTLGAAVSGFCLHFGVTRVNAVGVLPMHHVSGLMARIRCAATGGEYRPWDWKRLAAGERPTLSARGQDWFISLVPTQLQRLLEQKGGVDFLKQFRVVFIGGGPTWAELDSAAALAGLPVALSYGMTETAAMIAAQRPAVFLAGARDAGHPLPHAKIEVVDGVTGKRCPPEVAGRIRVGGESLFRGYFPDYQESRQFETEDLGVLTGEGTLHVLGRRDSAIITGGKKVWPIEVEAVLRATGAFTDVAVIGVPDTRWGESVVACYPTDGLSGPLDAATRALEAGLAPYKHPKRFVAIAEWPRNAQGKLNRARLRELVQI